MATTEKELAAEIKKVFRKLKIDFQDNVVVGNNSADFFVTSPSGSSAVFEIKTWDSTPSNQARASRWASLSKGTSGANDAFVVLPDLANNKPERGLLSAKNFSEFIETYVSEAEEKPRAKRPTVKPKPEKLIFASMPFEPKYDDTFLVAMQPASLEAGADCNRVDHENFVGDIVKEIKNLIGRSVAVIADLSESRPNVLYEMGLAEAMGRPIIQICSTSLEKLPFDVRNNKTIEYEIGQTSRLKKRLTKEIQAVLS